MNFISLTPPSFGFTLALPSQKTKVGFRSSEISGLKAALHAVFLCPSQILSTALNRLKSVMVGCIGQSSDWPVPEAGTANLVQSASNNFAVVRGGYFPTSGETAMHHPTPNPSTHQNASTTVMSDNAVLNLLQIGIFEVVNSAEFAEQQIKTDKHIRQATLNMLIDDLEHLLSVCKAAMEAEK